MMIPRLQALRDYASDRGVPAPRSETRRILSLPRCPEDRTAAEVDLTHELRRTPNAPPLRPIQSAALHEMRRVGGLIGPIGVGHGKFLISTLAPVVLGAQRPLLLVPAPLLRQTHIEMAKWRPLYQIPHIEVRSYAILSTPDSAQLLEQLRPDLIIADEAHKLRHRTSARTKRIIRYAQEHPDTRFVFLSGTLTSKGLADYVHLTELALRESAPLPLDYNEFQSWSRAIDVGGEPGPGDLHAVAPLVEWAGAEDPRDAFLTRWRSSPGVVTTDLQALDLPLEVRRRRLTLPLRVRWALRDLGNTWQSPDGVELASALDVARYQKHLLQGFYYIWIWKNDERDEPWLEARQHWARQVRRVLQWGRQNMDSPALVERWARSRGCTDVHLVDAWHRWDAVQGRGPVDVEAVWVSTYMLDAIEEAIRTSPEPLLVWLEHRAPAEALRERGIPVFGPDDELPQKPISCALSRRAHGTGKNLQAWHSNLLTSFPSNGSILEQLIGRTHRPGQGHDRVTIDYFDMHFSVQRDIESALADAEYIQRTQGTRQKILTASWSQ